MIDSIQGFSAYLFKHLDRKTLSERDKDQNTVLHRASEYNFFPEGNLPQDLPLEAINALVDIYPEGLTELNSNSESPYQRLKSTYLKSSTTSKANSEANSITKFLLDQYMHF